MFILHLSHFDTVLFYCFYFVSTGTVIFTPVYLFIFLCIYFVSACTCIVLSY